MLKAKTTAVPVFSRFPLTSLNIATSYSPSSSNTSLTPTSFNMSTTANLTLILYQQHTAPKIGSFASLQSSSFVPIVHPINPNPSLVITQSYTVPCYCNERICIKISDGLDHIINPAEELHQIDANMIFIVAE